MKLWFTKKRWNICNTKISQSAVYLCLYMCMCCIITSITIITVATTCVLILAHQTCSMYSRAAFIWGRYYAITILARVLSDIVSRAATWARCRVYLKKCGLSLIAYIATFKATPCAMSSRWCVALLAVPDSHPLCVWDWILLKMMRLCSIV